MQQAILQVLEPLLDPTFSNFSYGFRPGRGAHDALAQARQYVAEGRTIVVDMDLEKFFDRVNHDILMARLARRMPHFSQCTEHVKSRIAGGQRL